MSYRWSLAENSEAWVDEHDEAEEICDECGVGTWNPLWDADPFCTDCYISIFGEDE